MAQSTPTRRAGATGTAPLGHGCPLSRNPMYGSSMPERGAAWVTFGRTTWIVRKLQPDASALTLDLLNSSFLLFTRFSEDPHSSLTRLS
jgi:hypothetical protein